MKTGVRGLTLALVRDMRELREPWGAEETEAFETDVLARGSTEPPVAIVTGWGTLLIDVRPEPLIGKAPAVPAGRTPRDACGRGRDPTTVA